MMPLQGTIPLCITPVAPNPFRMPLHASIQPAMFVILTLCAEFKLLDSGKHVDSFAAGVKLTALTMNAIF
jgi:hypothetical protein